MNFEIAATDEMVAIAEKIRPHAVTLVPEKRQELTTEGGLDLTAVRRDIEPKIERLRKANCLVSLFIEADLDMIKLSSEMGAQAIEFHTGDFCHKMADVRTSKEQWDLVKPLQLAAEKAHELGLQVHFGHGLHYQNAHWLQTINHCEEANIGHAVVSRAIFVGLKEAVSEMKSLLNDPTYQPMVSQG